MMPIRPENRDRYPREWKTIRAAILARADNRCEGSPLWPDCRAENGQPHPVTGSRTVLTIAHLDHTPENCDPFPTVRLAEAVLMPDPDTSALLTLVLLMAVEVIGIALWGLMKGETK